MATIVGQLDGYYLIDLGIQKSFGHDDHMGQIYYEDENKLYPVNNLASLQTHDDWEPYLGDQSVLEEWMNTATKIPDSITQSYSFEKQQEILPETM